MGPRNSGTGRQRTWLYLILYVSAGLVLTAALLCCGSAGVAGFSSLSLPLLGIAVLTNVEAGKNRFGRYKAYGIPDIVGPDDLVEETETMEEIDGAIERTSSHGERLICINGGDGTMQRTITHMINKYGEQAVGIPVLFPLRGGTMNLLADHLKIKGKTPELLRRAVAAERLSQELPYIELPTLRVTREIGGREEKNTGFSTATGPFIASTASITGRPWAVR